MKHSLPFIIVIILVAGTFRAATASAITTATGSATVNPKYSNITFTQNNSLDIYIPDNFAITKGGRGDANTPYPAIIAISNDGTKDYSAIAQMLQALPYGYAVVAIGYCDSLPSSVANIISAIKWIKANGHNYRLDPHKIILWGNSHGGYLAALAACSGTYLQGFNTEMEFYNSNQMAQAQSTEQYLQKMATEFGADNTNNATKVQAIIDLYGFIHPPQDSLVSASQQPSTLSPQQFITPQTPPFFMMYGEADPYIPYTQANRFADSLKNAIGSSLVEYILIPSQGHGGEIFESPQFSRQIFVFLNKILF
ncbi:MAG: alpha/beta hydrolase [Bacteroidales bacterium]|nr:alpha/beta hydrolase [Bacteroidales bacterium]